MSVKTPLLKYIARERILGRRCIRRIRACTIVQMLMTGENERLAESLRHHFVSAIND